MTSAELRQSFLDFFEGKKHTIVPSASLMPDSPNLLFTNAGMNQFVPIFLAERTAPYPSAADTQKCIRAGGKHNDLDDVGFDTYHHTFFEMLGNWSFGDYFKKEAIEWAWELLTKVWKLPKERLYATVYKPGDGEPADFDEEAKKIWTEIFKKEGLDPDIHLIYSGKKDNFWMMGETGPCGPCSEVHIDLTPEADTKGSLVNMDSGRCIEIWNLVFIQFNANEDGSLTPLPARHVDTGMGFERVAGIIATTDNFTDFSKEPSNYDSDLFTDLFDALSKRCGKEYKATIPSSREGMSDQELVDFAFRVIADHIRTLSFSIADGILPGNEGRNYVLRRILRRAVLFGRKLDLPSGFFAELVDTLVPKMSPFFPELAEHRKMVRSVIQSEEASFERTISRGLQMLDKIAESGSGKISGKDAFTLYDTHGFPIDLTQLIAVEKGLSVDMDGFEKEMNRQRKQSQEAIKRSVISVKSGNNEQEATHFVGFDPKNLKSYTTTLLDLVKGEKEEQYLVFPESNFYAEMGGQLGDTGHAEVNGKNLEIINTIKDASGRFLHQIKSPLSEIEMGSAVELNVDIKRRQALQAHHSATHILHWAMRKVLGTHIHQAGSLVDKNRLRFDFSHFKAVSTEEQREIEQLVNEKLILNASVKTYEVPYSEKPDDVIAFFGEKYSDVVRVVDIGGYSKELCGGTHVAHTGEIGFFKIVSESAIAAGTRRIEAIVANSAASYIYNLTDTLQTLSGKLACKPDNLLAKLDALEAQKNELQKKLQSFEQKGQANLAQDLANSAVEKDGIKWIWAIPAGVSSKELRNVAVQVSKKVENSVVVLGISDGKKASVLALCSDGAIQKGIKAGDIIRDLTSKLGGKGGGKPDFAMGGAPASKDALKKALNEIL